MSAIPRTAAQTLFVRVFFVLAVLILVVVTAIPQAGAQNPELLHVRSVRMEPPARGRIFLSLPASPAGVGKQFSAVVAVRGGAAPYQFTVNRGALPPGLSLNSSTGSISGIPSAAGTYLFHVAATDHPLTDSGDRWLGIVVTGSTPAPVTVAVTPSSTALASGKSQQFSVVVRNTTNAAVTWKASLGTISASGLYTAPQVSSNATAIITATSVANSAASATASVTISTSSRHL